MNQDLRTSVSRRLPIPVAIVMVFSLLAPQPATPQESNASNPKEPTDLETSVRRPLQQRLEAAYPDGFRAGVEIFWESRDGWVSPEVFEWWADRIDPKGLNWSAAQPMFSLLSGQTPVFLSPNQRQKCAVVGASRNLLGSGYGPQIDAHDVVIRVNRAPTEDFRSDVGEKTTHHVAWPTDLGENQADRRAILLMNPMTLHTPNLFDRILNLVENELGWDPERIRIIHPEFVRYLHQHWMEARGGFPSTGFIALMIAVHVCDVVDVFGFGADAEGRWDRYYEDDPMVPTDLHPAEFEGDFRRELGENGIVTVFPGNRSESGVELRGYQKDVSERD